MPLYKYKNPKTGEEFEEFRSISKSKKPFILEDGTECQFVEQVSLGIGTIMTKKNKEVFEFDADYTRLTNPKYIRFQDGHRERYDPTKHWGGKGVGNNSNKLENQEKFPHGKDGKKIFRKGVWWNWNSKEEIWEQE